MRETVTNIKQRMLISYVNLFIYLWLFNLQVFRRKGAVFFLLSLYMKDHRLFLTQKWKTKDIVFNYCKGTPAKVYNVPSVHFVPPT